MNLKEASKKMKTNKLFLTLASLIILAIALQSISVSALSISQNYDAGYTRVKDKWIYREDLTGGHRGFTLTHKYVLPTENIQVTVNDKPTTNNNQILNSNNIVVGGGFGSGSGISSFSSLSSFNSLGSGRSSFSSLSGYGNDRAISDAFDTYQENTRPRYGYGGFSGYGNYGYGGYYNSWGSGVVRLGW